MFWQRTDHAVVEKAAPVLPKEATPASPIPVQRPPRSGLSIKISWHGPYSLQEATADAFRHGIYLLVSKKGDQELIGCSTRSPYREAKKQAGIKQFNDDAFVWVGEVAHDSGKPVSDAVLQRVSKALIFFSQPTSNIKWRKGLWIQNRWPDGSLDAPLFISKQIIDRNPGLTEIIPGPEGDKWITGLAIALLLTASLALFLAFHPLDAVAAKVRAQLKDAQRNFAQAQAHVEQVTLKLNEASLKLSTALQRINFLEIENAGLRAKLAAPQHVTAASGASIELQSCWKRGDGKPLPVYRIDIRDDAFGVEPAWTDAGAHWPDALASTMKDFPAAPVAASALSQDAFAAVMQHYYDFGTAPNRNCRFFVDVTDSTTTKEAWKAGLARVERYFYKRLVAL